MKKLVYRNCSLPLLIVSIMVYCIPIIIGIVVMNIVITSDDPAFFPTMRYAIVLAYGALFCLPCVCLIITTCIAYTETIVIADDAVVSYRGTNQIRYMPRGEITTFGCASFMHRSAYIFFCSTPVDNILNYAQQHKKDMVRLFGKQRVAEALKTEEGYRQIAIGTYIQQERRKNQGSIIILKEARDKQLNELREILQENLVFTGPIFMDQPEFNNKYK